MRARYGEMVQKAGGGGIILPGGALEKGQEVDATMAKERRKRAAERCKNGGGEGGGCESGKMV